MLGAGSDQSKSHKIPLSGISEGLFSLSIYFKFFKSGLKPPCMHNILSSTTAATGKWLNKFMNVFHSFGLNLLQHSSQNP